MDFNELMSLATQNEKGSDKKRGYAFNLSAPKKENKQKPKSDVVQRLINEKEREKQKVLEKRELKRIEDEKKKIFRIPKADSPSTVESSGKKKNHDKNNKSQSGSKSSKESKPKVPEKPKLKLEEAVFKDLQSTNELYTGTGNLKDRARINFGGSFAVVRIAHKRNEGVPLPQRPVITPVKETPKFNVALVKKSEVVNSDNSNMNSHKASRPTEDVSETVKKLKEKYGVDPDGIKRDRPKSTTRRDNKLKEIAKYKEKVKMREKLKMNAKKVPKPVQSKPKIIKRANNNAPPPMNFADLLKMAENKAKEPVVAEPVVKKPKKVEEERPMTREEREWAEKKKDWNDRKKSKEYQARLGKVQPPNRSSKSSDSSYNSRPKDSQNSNRNNNSVKSKNLNSSHSTPHKDQSDRKSATASSPASNGNRPAKTTPNTNRLSSSKDQRGYEQQHVREKDHRGYEQDRDRQRDHRAYEQDRNKQRDQRGYEQNRDRQRDQRGYEQNRDRQRDQRGYEQNCDRQRDHRAYEPDRNKQRDQRGYGQDRNKERDRPNSAPSKDIRTPLKRKSDQASESLRDSGPSQPKKKALPPPEEPTNPWDRIYGNIQKNRPKKPVMKKKMVIDSEDEYDSELDDFIDDGEDESADYSSAIRQIFGYDKRRFRDEDDDVDNMESNFASCMKEEARSARLGLKEDLEDIRKEQEEERLKALRKKKMKNR